MAASIIVACIGVPLPITLMLLAAGAFAGAGLGDYNILLLVLIAFSSSVIGDSISYYIGRRAGSALFNWLARRRVISPKTLEHSRIYFNRRGGWAILLTRFIFTALGSATSMLAGSELYSYRRFLVYDISGNLIGVLIPLTLGYFFEASWDGVGDILGTFSIFATALVVALYLILRLIKLVRYLRSAQKAAEHHAVPQKEHELSGAASKAE